MASFYHIFIISKKSATKEDVEEKMNLAIDWFRCNSNVWIVYSTSDENKWQIRLRPLVEPEGTLFICKLEIAQRSGWMTRKFWNWLNKYA